MIPFLDDLKVIDLAAGAFHSLFLLDNGSILASGRNFRGAMGGSVNISETSARPLLIPNFSTEKVV